MSRVSEPSSFMTVWEENIATMLDDEIEHWFNQCKATGGPLHPNTNMVWLYDRLLMEMVERGGR